MSQKHFHAFIDNQEILIISSDGCNLKQEIKEQESIQIKIKVLIGLLGLVGFSALCILASQAFFSKFTDHQNMVLGIIVFISGGVVANSVDYLMGSMRKTQYMKKTFNLAKKDLQNDIMDLEKVLLEHQASVKELRLKDKFIFSEIFKKSPLEKEN